MPDSKVYLVVNDYQYYGWKSISIERSIESVCGKFHCSLIDTSSVINPVLAPGAECQVLIGSNILIYGYIDSVDLDISSTQVVYTISGRDKTEDIIDGCVQLSPGTWKNQQLFNFAGILCNKVGVNSVSDGSFTDEAATYTVEIGDTIFTAIHRPAKARGVILLTDFLGRLKLTTPGASKADDALQLGRNVKSMRVSVDYTNRFNKYIIRAQRTSGGGGWGSNPATITIHGEATDPNIRASRVLVLPAEDQVSSRLAMKRAQWEASTRNAMSETITITIPEFYQSSDRLWKENEIVNVSGEYGQFTINSDYLITSVTYSLDNGGRLTTLTLRDKDSFKPEPIVPQKASKQKGKSKWL